MAKKTPKARSRVMSSSSPIPTINFEVVVQPESGGVSVFADDVYPTVSSLDRFRPPQDKSVLVGAGDIGHKSYSFFQDLNPEDGITYFATGIANRESDTVARMDFSAEGRVTLQAVSLTGQPVQAAFTTLEGFPRWPKRG